MPVCARHTVTSCPQHSTTRRVTRNKRLLIPPVPPNHHHGRNKPRKGASEKWNLPVQEPFRPQIRRNRIAPTRGDHLFDAPFLGSLRGERLVALRRSPPRDKRIPLSRAELCISCHVFCKGGSIAILGFVFDILVCKEAKVAFSYALTCDDTALYTAHTTVWHLHFKHKPQNGC